MSIHTCLFVLLLVLAFAIEKSVADQDAPSLTCSPPCKNDSPCVNADDDNGNFCDCSPLVVSGVAVAGEFCQVMATSICGDSAQNGLQFCLNDGLCTDPSSDGATCICPANFVGPRCEYTLNEFVPCTLACQNRGTCFRGSKIYGDVFDDVRADLPMIFFDNDDAEVLSIGTDHCHCPLGFIGIQCEIPYQFCGDANKNHICLHGSTCVQSGNGSETETTPSFKCDCTTSTSPTFGTYCENVLDPDDCDLECFNGGQCDFAFNDNINDNDATDGSAAFAPFCKCLEGFSGFQCQFEDNGGDGCTLNCQNGGICEFVRRRHHRFLEDDGPFNEQICTCPHGFVGEYCEQLDTGGGGDECTLVCLNGGVCGSFTRQLRMLDEDPSDGQFCTCPDGFEGEFCEIASGGGDCTLTCQNGGICGFTRRRQLRSLDQDPFDGQFCTCPDGFEGEFCEIISQDPCTLDCQNGGICSLEESLVVDVVAGLTDSNQIQVCKCLDGYSGTVCEISKECTLDCQNGGTCDPASGSLPVEEQFCDCPAGFVGQLCQDQECTLECFNGGVCRLEPVLDEAVERIGNNSSYMEQVCDCLDGFSGMQCEISEDCALNCQNGGICQNLDPIGDNQTCVCLEGFTGTVCDQVCNLDCKNGGVCEIGPGEPGEEICKCPPEYVGESCEKLQDLNQTQIPSNDTDATGNVTSTPSSPSAVGDPSCAKGSVHPKLATSLAVVTSIFFYIGWGA